ncbi:MULTISPECIES: hypothetical protein [unclassified Okeania]|uniref:Uncharacterized protein n=1 Tax=Okeania hirsuta TaxID=1458930 RepID=A0A3N6NMQ5_9CYAN|nr:MULTISPECIES: hypothetical protein [unclassified Okeania]NET78547.1 hypothetical protein [Okeania sp. SIO1F9]RQH10397.1 hypothetical protein D4Z78_27920 [Okeania hirsuta]NEP87162.1 hypothetical protein [Okeania sp. SIO2C2]NES76950.1 hypothetical protein [Okeania sp. SIO1H4]NET20624.1 hypothetical protein [Okeania sp. SIO1H5]
MPVAYYAQKVYIFFTRCLLDISRKEGIGNRYGGGNNIKSGSIGVIRWGDGEMGRWGDGEIFGNG